MLEKLYVINLSLIITHEIDSAFWREWEMFHLPGGIQFFNIINFFLIMILIFGFSAVLKKSRKGFVCSLILSITGLAAFVIHGFFLLGGYEQFVLPVSLLLLFFCAVISLWQFIYTIQKKTLFIKE